MAGTGRRHARWKGLQMPCRTPTDGPPAIHPTCGAVWPAHPRVPVPDPIRRVRCACLAMGVHLHGSPLSLSARQADYQDLAPASAAFTPPGLDRSGTYSVSPRCLPCLPVAAITVHADPCQFRTNPAGQSRRHGQPDAVWTWLCVQVCRDLVAYGAMQALGQPLTADQILSCLGHPVIT